MDSAETNHAYLYTTVIPVLLGSPSMAGKAAKDMYLRHEITPHWFGCGSSLRLWGYTKRHPLPRPVSDMSDGLLLQILLDFADEQSGLLALYPCSPEAEAFVERQTQALESRFVILTLTEARDPLSLVVLKND